jgi:hypothetical protein
VSHRSAKTLGLRGVIVDVHCVDFFSYFGVVSRNMPGEEGAAGCNSKLSSFVSWLYAFV